MGQTESKATSGLGTGHTQAGTLIPLWAPTMPVELDDDGDLVVCPHWIQEPDNIVWLEHVPWALDGPVRRCIRVAGHSGGCI